MNFDELRQQDPWGWVHAALRAGLDINEPDDDGNYLLLLACQHRDKNAVDQALTLGADLHQVDAAGRGALMWALAGPYEEFEDDFQTELESIIHMLVAAGANTAVWGDEYKHQGMSAFAIALGMDLKQALPGLVPSGYALEQLVQTLQPPAPSPQQYAEYCGAQRYGVANPSVMNNPVWIWLTHTRKSAWVADEFKYRSRSYGDPNQYPGWSFDRFGRSSTHLPDGRTIHIGGEHEDDYDPDFFIYNDVVVQDVCGAITIYGYPRKVFEPTDFHAATLIGNSMVVIGCFGYPGQRRYGTTPVKRLNLDTFAFEDVTTSGDAPGWIYGHHTRLLEDGRTLLVTGGTILPGPKLADRENLHDWALDLETLTWTCSLKRAWTEWIFLRCDQKRNHISELRHLLWAQQYMPDSYLEDLNKLTQDMGHQPNLGLLGDLYCPPGWQTLARRRHDALGVIRLQRVGTTVRVTEDRFTVNVVIEGELDPHLQHDLREHILSQLEALEGVAWQDTP